MSITRKCNDCGRYTDRVRCSCGSSNTGTVECYDCGWAFDSDCDYNCPNCGSEETSIIEETFEDAEWMYPNGYDED